jgi:hypothetical protein
VLAELVTGVLHGLGDGVEGGLGAFELRGESAFVADGGGEALLLQHGLERVEDLGDGLEAVGEGGEAVGHDHEFLEVDRGVRVGAAVDDVGHRNGQDLGVGPAEVLEEGLAEAGPAAWAVASDTARMALAPSFDLVSVPSSLSMMRIDADLVRGVFAEQLGGDLGPTFLTALVTPLPR